MARASYRTFPHAGDSRSTFKEYLVTHANAQQQGAGRASAPQAPKGDVDQESYYDLLGVPLTATTAQITTAYRTAMKRAHPDRVKPEYRAAAEELSKDLNRAFRTLANPAERLQYDRSIRAQESQDQIMRRYVGGFSGPATGGHDPYASNLRRQASPAERRDHRRSERSAVVTLLSVFLVVTLGAIGLLLIGGLLSFVWGQFFA